MASSFLDVSFEKLLKKLASAEFETFFLGKKSINDLRNALIMKLERIRSRVDDAEDKLTIDPRVNAWLKLLKGVVFEVDNLAEEIEAEVQISKQESIFTEFDKTVQQDIIKFSNDLDILLNEASRLDLKRRSVISLQLTPFVPRKDKIFGRDVEKEKILKFLLSSGEHVQGNKIGVLPIVGMGGIGKTTLARLVYDDERVNEQVFELKAWVTVSQNFDAFKIMKGLLQQIGSTSYTNDNEPAILSRKTMEALRGKKFLFVLNDVWNEDYNKWDLLMSHFTSGDFRSKIIVTTRNRGVSLMVETVPTLLLEFLSLDDSWEMFVHLAFHGDTNVDPIILDAFGPRIVRRCEGLPLAVKCVGGLLSSERNPNTWESILNRIDQWDSDSILLPALWLCYRYLPSPVKQCFAYCAKFPEGFIRGCCNRMRMKWATSILKL